MLWRIDRWVGRTIFHPPIIALCQISGMTQRAVYRYGWMLATWTLLMRISFEGLGDWLFAALAILITVIETARAAFMPDAPAPRNDALRIIVLVFTVIDIVGLVIGTARHGFHGFTWSHAWDMFALIAEYAKTIDVVPPPETKASRAAARRPA